MLFFIQDGGKIRRCVGVARDSDPTQRVLLNRSHLNARGCVFLFFVFFVLFVCFRGEGKLLLESFQHFCPPSLPLHLKDVFCV